MGVFTGIKCDNCPTHEELTSAQTMPLGWMKISVSSVRLKDVVVCSTKCGLKWLRDKEKADKCPSADPDSYCKTHCLPSMDHEQSGHDENCPKGKAFPR
jgi:hypothetical protein